MLLITSGEPKNIAHTAFLMRVESFPECIRMGGWKMLPENKRIKEWRIN